MDIVNFPEVNSTYGKDQPEYLPLPAHRVQDPTGTVISCWRLSWRERFKIIFTGRVWLSLLTFGQPIQPQLMTVDKPEMFNKGGE
jgi:hypothetical protein